MKTVFYFKILVCCFVFSPMLNAQQLSVGSPNNELHHNGNIDKKMFGELTEVIVNGVPWFDQNSNTVNAHGACIVEEDGRYYLFGEYKTDSVNKFIGFSCYSSYNLTDWKFEKIVLSQQTDGLLGKNRIGERVKVMRCPSTGEFVMYMHTDNQGYTDPVIGYATCTTIAGDYEFRGALLHHGNPIKRWDMGTFQDTDGAGYLLIHHGDIYRLNEDYKSVEKLLPHVEGMGEAPAMFKKNGIYYLLSSGLTSWERNDNFYHTANNIDGTWTKHGLFCPENSLTYNSQTTFVFPLIRGNDTIPMFMGDRWSFPKQAAAATYVWLPLQTDGTKLSVAEYWQAWTPNFPSLPYQIAGKLNKETNWKSNTKGATFEKKFKGEKIFIFGESNQHGGYGRITVSDTKGKIWLNTVVDFYSKVPDKGIRFASPYLPKGKYTLKVEVTGENSTWTNKAKTIFYGSDDYFVTINSIVEQ